LFISYCVSRSLQKFSTPDRNRTADGLQFLAPPLPGPPPGAVSSFALFQGKLFATGPFLISPIRCCKIDVSASRRRAPCHLFLFYSRIRGLSQYPSSWRRLSSPTQTALLNHLWFPTTFFFLFHRPPFRTSRPSPHLLFFLKCKIGLVSGIADSDVSLVPCWYREAYTPPSLAFPHL